MIEITLKVDDVDYDRLAQLLLPALIRQLEQDSLGRIFVRSPEAANATAMKLLGRMSQAQKDELLVKYLTQHSAQGAEKLQEMAKQNGVSLRITELSARTL